MASPNELFSQQASNYQKFRPVYPDALYRYLSQQCRDKERAWDAGTGNGQCAVELANLFESVVATDLSDGQLANAIAHPKVEYRKAPSENSSLPPDSVDLITVAQAFHWFNEAAFFKECDRVLKSGGLLALWGYGLATISPEIDANVFSLYEGVLGPYWEKERKLVENEYATCSFPYPLLSAPDFVMEAEWTFQHLLGYLSTWSALQTFKKKTGNNPLESFGHSLKSAWGSADTRKVQWKLFLKVGRKP